MVRELVVWRKLHHPNIHRLLGFAQVDGFPSLISEWMEKSTAKKYIKNFNVGMNERYEIVSDQLSDMISILDKLTRRQCTQLKGVADGMCYLHDGGIVHSDLKPVRSSLPYQCSSNESPPTRIMYSSAPTEVLFSTISVSQG